MPAVSVVVPNYNHARYLPRRLETILAQTFSDFEVILLDDASTDHSHAVIAPYLSDPRIRFHPGATNSGSPFAQWNRGVALARGEFVWIAESDDYADPHLLESLVALLRAAPNVGIAYCQSWRVDEDGRVEGSMSDDVVGLDAQRWQHPFVADGREECRRFLLWKNTLPNASAVVFRREVFLRAGGAPLHLRLAGDWLTWVRMLLLSDVAFTPEPLNYFRQHGASVRAGTPRYQWFDEQWCVRHELLQRGVVAPADRRSIVAQTANEHLSRIRIGPRGRRWPEFLHGMKLFLPLYAANPLATLATVWSRSRKTRLLRPSSTPR